MAEEWMKPESDKSKMRTEQEIRDLLGKRQRILNLNLKNPSFPSLILIPVCAGEVRVLKWVLGESGFDY